MPYEDFRSIPETHENILRSCFLVGEEESLPKEVTKAYWDLCKVFNRCGNVPGLNDIAAMAYQLGAGSKTLKSEALTLPQLWKAKKIKRGDPVTVLWRSQYVQGTLQAVNAAGNVIVVLDGESEERKLSSDFVTVGCKEQAAV